MRYLITGAEEPFISSDSPLRILILPQYCAVSNIYIYTAGVTPASYIEISFILSLIYN